MFQSILQLRIGFIGGPLSSALVDDVPDPPEGISKEALGVFNVFAPFDAPLPNYRGVVFEAQRKCYHISVFASLRNCGCQSKLNCGTRWGITLGSQPFLDPLYTCNFLLFPLVLSPLCTVEFCQDIPKLCCRIWFVVLFSLRKMGGWGGRMLIFPALKPAKKRRKDLKPKEIAPLIIFS